MNLLRGLVLPLALAAPAVAPPAAPSPARPADATLSDRLSWNVRERTRRGLHELEQGELSAARRDLDRALALAPDAPLARFNSGTARLGDDDRQAAELLEQAARAAPPELAADAWYNLGNARLGAGESAGAVDAFVEALRRRPNFADAKINLELALREREQQQREQRQASSGDPESHQPARRAASSQDEFGQEERPQPDHESAPQQGQKPQAEDAESAPDPSTAPGAERSSEAKTPPEPTGRTRPSRAVERELPQFHDLPDMDAQQAAAILRAVDQLERAHRRALARQRALERARGDQDW